VKNSALYIYFSSLHVSGIYVPIIRRKLLYILYLASGLQTRRHPYRVTNTSVAYIQNFSPDDGHMDVRNM